MKKYNYTEIKKHIAELLPEEENRKLYLTLLVEAIEHINTLGADKWGIYCELKHGEMEFRILTTFFYIFRLRSKSIGFPLDKQWLDESEEFRERLEKSTRWKWGWGWEYRKITSKNGFYTPLKENEKIWLEVIKPLYRKFVEKAIKQQKGQLAERSQETYNPAVIRYLRDELGQYVPYPSYHEYLEGEDSKLPEELDNDDAEYSEGKVQKITVNRYERDPKARKACIEEYGTNCTICRFDFAEKYGDVGKGFIHVHHLKSLSSVGEEYIIDPKNDLRPVCPNCHAIIHKKRNPSYTIEEVTEFIKLKLLNQ